MRETLIWGAGGFATIGLFGAIGLGMLTLTNQERAPSLVSDTTITCALVAWRCLVLLVLVAIWQRIDDWATVWQRWVAANSPPATVPEKNPGQQQAPNPKPTKPKPVDDWKPPRVPDAQRH